ncbi:MAG: DUF523 and DUF1722 domain-containing protein [Acidobacteria bacterium]|nr:DUF523 and DUF1722 domain-containing protein [Acidobacteriota bacterium]
MEDLELTGGQGDGAAIRIGISSCILDEKVRFDGGHKHDPLVTGIMERFFQWVPVCPEAEIGLGTPRESLRLVGEATDPRPAACVENYRQGLVPLIVPITLLAHHFRRHPAPWVLDQTYLNPYPAELMLRNHV